jgi:hypothetical protein
MDFGPLIYNTTSKPRTFELTNLGEFPFDYSITNFNSAPPAAEEPAAGKKVGSATVWQACAGGSTSPAAPHANCTGL